MQMVACSCGEAFPRTLAGYAAMREHQGPGCDARIVEGFKADVEDATVAFFVDREGKDAELWAWSECKHPDLISTVGSDGWVCLDCGTVRQ